MTSESATLTALWRVPGVPAFVAGRFLASAGIWTERLAVGWLVWELTGSATWVGSVAALRMGPALVFGPIGGTLTDRFGSVRLLRLCHAGNALVLCALAFAGSAISIWAIATAVALLGTLQGLSAAPIKAVIPQIVPRALLGPAVPLSSATFQLAAFVGPALAGFSIAALGTSFALAVATAGHLTFVLILSRWSDAGAAAGPDGSGLVAGLIEAARQCATEPTLAPVFALHLAAAMLLRPLIDLMPAVAGALAPGDPTALGLLTAASGAGALAGAVWMTLRSRTERLAPRALAGSAAAALGIAALGAGLALGAAAWFAGAALLVVGAALVVRATASLTLVQLVARSPFRGRVVGLYSAILRGGTALGALALGLLADVAGLATALLFAAGLMIATLALFARSLLGAPRDTL